MKEKELLHFESIINKRASEWIVFIHGAGGSIKTWIYQINNLQKEYNLLLLDLRDHGMSKNIIPAQEDYSFSLISADIKKVLDHVGIVKAHFITLSMGSIVLQDFIAHYPKMVEKAIMAGGIFKANFTIKLFVHTAKLVNHILPYKAMYSAFSYLLMPRKRNQKARRLYQMQARKLDSKDYLKWVGLYKLFFDLLNSSYNNQLKNEVLIIMGNQDYIFKQSAHQYVNNQQNAQFVSIENAGHICNIEEPDIFNYLVLNFLKKKTTAIRKPRTKGLSYTN
ncbi:MAG: alpha/beta hydrolase [Cyclobacteriaceae bacterium]|jgi:pimeloyl-ACP methyl ester carboxylesterase|nr:alpha/beta hydrolase [Cyclobacteriaceae bacterium]